MLIRVILTTALTALCAACGGSAELTGYEQREAWLSGDLATDGELRWTEGSGLEPGASVEGAIEVGSVGEIAFGSLYVPVELTTTVGASDEGGANLRICHTVALFTGCTDVPIASPPDAEGEDHEHPADAGSDEGAEAPQ